MPRTPTRMRTGDPAQLRRRLRDIRASADSGNWHEREDAGYALRNLLEEDPAQVIALTRDWVSDESENVRRAACLGCLIRKAANWSRRYGRPSSIASRC
ncbi:MAG: hypothetical protein ACOZAM_04050 [Pseudomonadota bacterium]